jgi:hypothetical protein
VIAALLALYLGAAHAAERRFIPAQGARAAAATTEQLAQGGATAVLGVGLRPSAMHTRHELVKRARRGWKGVVVHVAVRKVHRGSGQQTAAKRRAR